MGMFDSIMFNCPGCGNEIEAQSKGGACILASYRPNSVPTDVASDANKDAPFECSNCGRNWIFEIPQIQCVQLIIRPCGIDDKNE